VLARIADEVRNFSPSLVFVDSFRSVVQSAQGMDRGAAGLQHFVQQLAMQMSSWEATTFLIGENLQPDHESEPLFTVADGLLYLSQLVRGDAMVRKMQVVKMRGAAQKLGAHTFRIDGRGVRIFPRALPRRAAPTISGKERLLLGVPQLDEMLGGGVPAGYSLLLVGPSGSGKTVLAAEFLAEGVRAGETGVIAAFEHGASRKLNQLVADGAVARVEIGTLELSTDEMLHELVTRIEAMRAKRVVIDSLSGFRLALSPACRDDFPESLYRLVAVLTGMGVTVLMTAEPEHHHAIGGFSGYDNAFIADAVVMQRFVELAGQLRRVISVVKVRGSEHSKDIRFFDIVDGRPRIGERLPA
jgi:circadian clock protein KaiC